MIRKIGTVAFAFAALACLHLTAFAAANGTADEAKAMVDKATKLIAEQGTEKAFPVIDDPTGGFVDRDLYVFVLDLNGTTVAHGTNKALIGKSLVNLKDADGKFFVQDIIAMAKNSGEGWVDYKWPNPVSKKVENKSSFVRKIGDLIVGVGIYKG